MSSISALFEVITLSDIPISKPIDYFTIELGRLHKEMCKTCEQSATFCTCGIIVSDILHTCCEHYFMQIYSSRVVFRLGHRSGEEF